MVLGQYRIQLLKNSLSLSPLPAAGYGDAVYRLCGYMCLDSSTQSQADTYKLMFDEQPNSRVSGLKFKLAFVQFIILSVPLKQQETSDSRLCIHPHSSALKINIYTIIDPSTQSQSAVSSPPGLFDSFTVNKDGHQLCDSTSAILAESDPPLQLPACPNTVREECVPDTPSVVDKM